MQPTRRLVLLGAGASALTACTADRSPRPAAPTLADTLHADAVTREQGLIDAYTTALQEHPELAPTLTAVLRDHRAHLAALRPDRSPSPPAPSLSDARTPPTSRRDPHTVLAELAALEREAAAAYAQAAERTETTLTCNRVLAPLLASLAASEASHVIFL